MDRIQRGGAGLAWYVNSMRKIKSAAAAAATNVQESRWEMA
jgi:hypothetical protein